MLMTESDLEPFDGLPTPLVLMPRPRTPRHWLAIAWRVCLWLLWLCACGAVVWVAMWVDAGH